MSQLPNPSVESLRAHPVVWIVILASIVSHLLIRSNGVDAVSGWFLPDTFSELAVLGAWKIWTPTFVHYTLLHLFANIYLWWYLGSQVEKNSRAELVLLFFITAAVSNTCQWYFAGPEFGGLSGVVYALLVYCWILQKNEPQPRFKLDKTVVILLLALLPLAATGLFGKFSDYAHAGGLVAGVALGYLSLAISDIKRTGEERD